MTKATNYYRIERHDNGFAVYVNDDPMPLSNHIHINDAEDAVRRYTRSDQRRANGTR